MANKLQGVLAETLNNDFGIFAIQRKSGFARKHRGYGTSRGCQRITKALLQLFHDNSDDEFTLDIICINLCIDKRKIYDIINVLASVDLVRKVSKGLYKFTSTAQSLKSVREMENLAEIESSVLRDRNLCWISHSVIAALKSGSKGTTLLNTLLCDFEEFDADYRKSRVKRIAGILRVLETIGLVRQKEGEVALALEGYKERLEALLSEQRVNLRTKRNPLKMQRLKDNVYKNISRMIEESKIYKCDEKEILKKRRTSSFDINIVEQYLNQQDGVVLPEVSVPFLKPHTPY